MKPPQLPVDEIAESLLGRLADAGAVVLTAPTGSGKTTRVPPMLLRAAAGTGRILVLQPRRLAARLVAARVAAELGTRLGDTVGFQTRHERVSSDATRILFLTEGLFLRQLLADPQLAGVDAVVLDEFHERSLAADLALGLCRRLRRGPRPDLRLVVMSATLDPGAVSTFLDAPVIEAQGRTWPVEMEYGPGLADAAVWDRAAAALRQWLDRRREGHVLMFLPGAYEIRRTVEACRRCLRPDDGDVDVLPLHGSLTARQQDAAVAPSATRKVIVSTNVAETSITIDGIACVVDSGLARVHRYDPARGVNALLVERISRAAADQRAGRAGRTGPGTCLRLWPRAEADARPLHDTPEVQRVDLAEAVLHLRALGVDDGAFDWLDPPPPERLAGARDLLRDLGALDAAGDLTADGGDMARLPAHPRLARLLLDGARAGVGERASVWAALISERDICARPVAARFRHPPDDGWPSDLVVRERALHQARRARFDPARCADLGLHAAACRDVDRAADQFRRLIRQLPAAPATTTDATDDERLARALLAAYADHLALRRDPATRACEMDSRRRVVLDEASAVGEAPVFVAVDVREVEAPRSDGGGVHTVASLATAVDAGWLPELFPGRVRETGDLVWDDDERAVFTETALRFGALTLRAERRAATGDPAASQLLVDRIGAGLLRFERWDDAVEAWIGRVRCVAGWFPERGLLTYDDDELAVIVAEIVGAATRWGAVRRAPCLDHVRHGLPWDDQRFVEDMAPEKLRLPSGYGMRITYAPGEPPRGRARIQDFYGLPDTPRVAAGRVPLLLEILAPNQRPAQVTDDLAGFWQRTYPELKRELSRRYPKHEWR